MVVLGGPRDDGSGGVKEGGGRFPKTHVNVIENFG